MLSGKVVSLDDFKKSKIVAIPTPVPMSEVQRDDEDEKKAESADPLLDKILLAHRVMGEVLKVYLSRCGH